MHRHNGSYRLWIRDRLGNRRRVSLETARQDHAVKIQTWVQDVYDRLDRLGVLASIVAGRLTPVQAFVLGEEDAARYVAAQDAEAADTAITDAMLGQWVAAVVRSGRRPATAAEYRRQVETLWPAPRVISWLTPQGITTALDALPVREQTKGRYKAALASLVAWLLRQGHLTSNPMPSVASYPQSPTRIVHYDRQEALTLLLALPPEQRALEGVMWACGWEWSAIANATAGDFDLTAGTAYARGTKTATRERLTVFTEEEPLLWMREQLRDKLPSAPAFPGLENTAVLKRHQAACKAAGVTVTTLHEWRHTFAVKELKKGRPMHWIARMLGHGTTQQLQARYGRMQLHEDEVLAYGVRPLLVPTVGASPIGQRTQQG